MSNKILRGFLFLILGFVLGISLINFVIDKRIMTELSEGIEFKKELISEYESYYNAAEELINSGSMDSTIYYESKNKIDSLYKTQL